MFISFERRENKVDIHLRRLAIFPQRGYVVPDSGRAEDRFWSSRSGEESPNTRGRDAA
jgi:hypothetical protein